MFWWKKCILGRKLNLKFSISFFKKTSSQEFMKAQLRKYTSFENLKTSPYQIPIRVWEEKELEYFVLLLRKAKRQNRYKFVRKAKNRQRIWKTN